MISATRKSSRLGALAFLALCAALLSPMVSAEPPPAIQVGTEFNFEPYAGVDIDGKATGFSVELFSAVTRAIGREANFHPAHWTAIWHGLKAGEFDALPLVARLPEREGEVEFTRPHTIGYDSFFVRRGSVAINTIEQARTLQIIVVRSDAAHHALASRGLSSQLVLVDTLHQGFQLLASGHFDAILAPKLQGSREIEHDALAKAVEAGPLLTEYRREFSFATRKGNTALRDQLDQGLARVKASGEYDRLYSKWLGIYDPPRFTTRQVASAAAAILLILGWLGVWTWMLRRQVARRTRQLTDEIAARKAAEAELNKRKDDLEEAVTERTAALEAANAKLEEARNAAFDLVDTSLQARQVAEEATAQAQLSEQRYRILFESSGDALALIGMGGFVDCNSAALRLFRCSARSDFVGRAPADISPLTQPNGKESGPLIAKSIDKALREGSLKGTWQHRRLDGSEFPAEIMLTRIDVPGCPLLLATMHDVTERQSMLATLAQARDAAEAANLAKSRFLANMSHEIRTPLHVIIGLAHLLQQSQIEVAEQHRLKQLLAHSEHLLALINAILDLSKIEAEKLTLQNTDVALAVALDKAVRMTNDAALAKGVTLAVEAEPSLRELRLRYDPTRLAQVLINLVSNAVKFTNEGTVRLTVSRLDEDADRVTLRIAVTDTGIGIAPADQARLFEPFVQGEETTARVLGGSGLGLAISQRLVAMMGSTIQLVSSPGKGSRFSFDVTFPRAASHTAAAQTPPAANLFGRHILLVEDHPLSQEILFEMIGNLGCEVDVASNGAEALACTQERNYDLILMDIQMPIMDGFATTHAIRTQQANQTTPIIALTANAFDEDRQRCLKAGMNGHIGKPVTPDSLAAILGQWLPSLTIPQADMSHWPAAAEIVLAGLSGFAVPSVLYRSPQDQAQYQTLLQNFVAMHGADMARLRQHLASNQRDAAHQVVHDLKGIAGLIGGKRIAALASDITQALNDDEDEVVIEALAASLEAELTKLEAVVRALPYSAGAGPL